MWPKKPTIWNDGERSCMSIPFTWNLPEVKKFLELSKRAWIVGGPAVRLMPYYLSSLQNVIVGKDDHNALRIVNPEATRTTQGCTNKCGFCAVPRMFGNIKAIPNWIPAPIICDDNILAAGFDHFETAIDKLISIQGVDFNQGLDAELLTIDHVVLLKKLSKVKVRLALDSDSDKANVRRAIEMLRFVGIPKKSISVYILIGWKGTFWEDEQRLEWADAFGVYVCPMWFHELDAMKENIVTNKQKNMDWTDERRKHVMQYYYQHRIRNVNMTKE